MKFVLNSIFRVSPRFATVVLFQDQTAVTVIGQCYLQQVRTVMNQLVHLLGKFQEYSSKLGSLQGCRVGLTISSWSQQMMVCSVDYKLQNAVKSGTRIKHYRLLGMPKMCFIKSRCIYYTSLYLYHKLLFCDYFCLQCTGYVYLIVLFCSLEVPSRDSLISVMPLEVTFPVSAVNKKSTVKVVMKNRDSKPYMVSHRIIVSPYKKLLNNLFNFLLEVFRHSVWNEE